MEGCMKSSTLWLQYWQCSELTPVRVQTREIYHTSSLFAFRLNNNEFVYGHQVGIHFFFFLIFLRPTMLSRKAWDSNLYNQAITTYSSVIFIPCLKLAHFDHWLSLAKRKLLISYRKSMKDEVGRNLIRVLFIFRMTLSQVGSTFYGPMDAWKNLQALCTKSYTLGWKAFLSLFSRIHW